MAHALGARATSLGASAVLMSGLVLVALTMTTTIVDIDFGPTPRAIEVLPPPEPPPPPTPTPPAPTPPLDAWTPSPLPPIETASTSGPSAPYAGPVAPAGPVEITAPHWLQRPRDLSRYYPPRALARSIEGEVLLNCLVQVSGLLECTVVSESPRGWGFSDAALRIARAHRMVPASRDGIAVEGRYAMRVPFQIE